MRTTTVVALLLILPFAYGGAAAQDSALALGERIYVDKCEYCHGAGVQKGGTFVLEARYEGAVPGLLTERTNLTAEYINAVVRTWTNGMAPFRPTEISDSEFEALVAFLTRNNE